MKVDLAKAVVNVDGKTPIVEEDGKSLTVKEVCINALLTPLKEDSEKEKWSDYEIFKKIRDSKEKEINLTAENVVRLKEKIGKIYPPLIMGQLWEELDG